jgi:hypothetical protein
MVAVIEGRIKMMDSSLDGLIRFLLEEIALCGPAGTFLEAHGSRLNFLSQANLKKPSICVSN